MTDIGGSIGICLSNKSGGKTYKNQTVSLDGIEFDNATFENVTWRYEGTAPVRMLHAHFVPGPDGKVSITLLSHNKLIEQVSSITAAMAQTAGCLNSNYETHHEENGSSN
jgi:hypothetical protein